MNGRIFLVCFILLSACSYTQKVKDGRTAFERKQYSVAVRLLEKEHNQSKSRVEKGRLAFLMAESYTRLNKSAQSIRWYQIAYDNQYGVDALREMAFALKRAERYKEAIQAFKDLGIEIGSPYEYRREVNACEIAVGWKTAEPQAEYAVKLLDFSGSYADYSPMPYKNGQLVFTSDRPTEKGSPVYAWTGNSFSNLFIADLQTNAVTLFDPNVNSPDNDGTATFNPDFTEMIFSRCFGGKKEDAYCKLMSSDLRNGAWSAPRILDFVQDKVNYVQPSLSADGRFLYFSSNHPDGWGGYDIYVSERKSGNWDEPVLLGRSINTTGNEKFPFIDNDTLYFSSDTHTGMGGLDIFRVYKLPNGTWSPPYNLKPPVNSGGDDFGFVLATRFPEGSDVLETGFFTSTREDGNGNDDIYQYEKRIPPPMPVADTIVKIRPEDVQMILDVYVVEKIYENPADPNSKVLGRKPLPGAQTDMRQGNETRKWTIEEDGFVSIPLQDAADYAFLASKPGYLNNAATFSTKGIGKDMSSPEMRFEIEIVLERIFLDKEIRLENIYYDFDRWEIRDDAKPTLDLLARLLVINPAIRIQLGSHTDCRGNDRYNQGLSQKRAQSAVDYLISKGISAERLSAFGFGETTPEVSCICTRCTEDEHQQNRRTTFKILE